MAYISLVYFSLTYREFSYPEDSRFVRRASAPSPSNKRIKNMEISMEYWWSDNERGIN